MSCEAVNSRGARCKMPALKGEARCWAHSQAHAQARHEARRRGGVLRRRAPLQAPVAALGAPPVMPAFELPKVERKGDIADRLLRVVQAVASGELDARRGRLLVEGLRSAREAWESSTASTDELPAGARELTEREARFMVEHRGQLPPDVHFFNGRPTPLLVEGPVWAGGDGEHEAG